jgi:cytochrome c556
MVEKSSNKRRIELMEDKAKIMRLLPAVCVAVACAAGIAFSVNAQTASGPNAGRRAVETRRAVYTLIGANFGPLGNVVKGSTPYDEAEVAKRIDRVAFLAGLLSLNESYPDASNLGEPDTKAKADIWENRPDFEKKLKEFQDHAVALARVNATEKADSDAFKTAVNTLGQDCKACHDSFRAK